MEDRLGCEAPRSNQLEIVGRELVYIAVDLVGWWEMKIKIINGDDGISSLGLLVASHRLLLPGNRHSTLARSALRLEREKRKKKHT